MVTTDKVTVTEFAPHIGKTTTDYKENDMGVWKKEDNRKKSFAFICSECGRRVYDIWYDEKTKETKCRYKFCPFCGKPMEVE